MGAERAADEVSPPDRDPPGHPEIVLVRHGETEWSRDGRHTGRTDVPLTKLGREEAVLVGRRLQGRRFSRILTSPLSRASETCELAGFGAVAERRPELAEWDYGDYEGMTRHEVRAGRPGWTPWSDGCPGGEDLADVTARIDRIVADLRSIQGAVAVFGHGHSLRVLAARWIELPGVAGARLTLGTAALGFVGYDRELAAILAWNDRSHLPADALA
jgi:broad specificity phosphatase PhoE